MNGFIKENIFNITYITGAHRLFRPVYGGIGSILMFHRIVPDSSPHRIPGAHEIEVTPEYLEESILWFKSKGYEIISLDEMYRRINKFNENKNSENRFKKKWVVFTLDDGYIDNYIYAYPIFKRHNIPFTIYLATSFPEGEAIIWWYLIEDMVKKNDVVNACINGVNKSFKVDSLEKQIGVYTILVNIFRAALKENNERELLLKIFGIKKDEIYQKSRECSLSWKQVIELSNDPLCTIGAHSMNHTNLRSLSDDKCRREIIDSGLHIENKIGKKIEHFCYPYGTKAEADEREMDIVADSSYKTATTTRWANVFYDHKSCCQSLPRVPMGRAQMQKGVKWLTMWTDGVLPALKNRFRRVITK